MPVVTPHNTLANLATLSTGTPRFEMNSAGNEEHVEEKEKKEEQEEAPAEEKEEPKEAAPVEPEVTSVTGPAEGRQEASAVAKEGLPEGENLEPETETMNGKGKSEEKEESPKMLEVPEDELMRITGEEPERSETGAPEEIDLVGEEERRENEGTEEEEKGAEEERELIQFEETEQKEKEGKAEETVQIVEEEVEKEGEVVQIEEEKVAEPIEEEVVVPEEEKKEEVEVMVQPEENKKIEEEVKEVEEVEEVEEVKEVEEIRKEEVQEEGTEEKEEVAEVEKVAEVEEVAKVEEVAEVEEVQEEEAVEERQEEKEAQVEEKVVSEKEEEKVEEVEEPVKEVEVVVEPENKLEEEEKSEEKSEKVEKIEEEEKEESEKEESEKEEPKVEKNPIQLRNEQISEDEEEENFRVRGANKVFAWGSAECDQFECTNYESRRPVEISFFSSNKIKVAKITCGSQHTLLLDTKGKVYSWGNSDDGVLGRDISEGDSDSRPGLVDLESQVDLISAGDAHSIFANSQTGEMFFSGVIKSSKGKLSRVIDIPESITINKFKKSGIKSVISGANHVLIHSRFNVYSFGDNSCGALGYILRTYDERSDCLTPHALRLKGIARIFTGAYHCFAITNKGILKTWGLNSQGQLGLPYYLDNPEDSDVNNECPHRNPNVLQLPHQVGGIEGRKIVDIVGGEHHTLLLMSDGSVWGAGRNDEGQLGGLEKPARESYEEVRIPNSRVRVAGTNSYVNVTEDYMPNTFMRLPIEKGFQQVMSRSHYNYAINRSEKDWPKIYSWGSGFSYVLGNGKEEPLSTPFRISNQKLFKGLVPNQVALGFSHVVYYTGDTHDIVLDAPKPRNTRKRDRFTPVKRNERYRGKKVKSK